MYVDVCPMLAQHDATEMGRPHRLDSESNGHRAVCAGDLVEVEDVVEVDEVLCHRLAPIG